MVGGMTAARLRGRLAALAWMAFLAVMAAACGGGDAASESTTGEQEETAAAEPSGETEGASEESSGDLALQEHRVAMGGGPAGGSSFNIAAAMAEVIRTEVPNLDLTAEEVTIAPSNMTRLGNGEIQLAFNTTYDVYRAVEGIQDFEGQAVEGLQFVMGGTLGGFGVVTPQSSGITEWSQLCGANFGIGSETAKAILSSLMEMEGVDPDCVNWNLGISYDQIVVGFQDETINAAGFVAIPVASATQQLVETVDVNFLSLSEDKIEAHDEEYPYFPAQVVPAGTLAQQEEDWVIAGFVQGIWSHESVPEDLVYQFTQGIFENIEACKAIFAGCEDYTVERSAEWVNEGLVDVPVHPGAQRYYEEVGADIG